MEREFWVKTTILPLFERGKSLEVRVRNGFTKRIRVGDVLFINRKIRRKVNAIRSYSDFPAMLCVENARHIHPDLDRENLLQFMRSLCPTHLEKLGVLVFELEPFSN